MMIFNPDKWNAFSRYKGDWKRNRPHGFGRLFQYHVEYEGMWKDGCPHGPGFIIYDNLHFVDGLFYEGYTKGFRFERALGNSFVTQMRGNLKKGED